MKGKRSVSNGLIAQRLMGKIERRVPRVGPKISDFSVVCYPQRMSPNEIAMKNLALAWRDAGPALRAMRHADIRRQDNALAIVALNSLFRVAIKQNPPRPSSGFVKMYEILGRQTSGIRR